MPRLSFPPCSKILNGFRPFSSFGFTVPNRKLPCLAPVLAFLLLAATPLCALAGQTTTIDGDVPGYVYGNNTPPYPVAAWPPTNLGDPTDNTVIINSGTVDKDVYGANAITTGADPAAATNNHVTVGSNGTVKGDVSAGRADSQTGTATVTGNTVDISGGTVTGSFYGGRAYSSSGTAIATGNSAIIRGGTVDGAVDGGFARGDNAAASGNTVTISGGAVTGSVYGGRANGDEATASGNFVTISGGSVTGSVYGGYTNTSISGGTTTATGNTVTVGSNGTVKGDVSAGRADSQTGTATVTGNTVDISGGSVTGSVYGGYASTNGGTATATGNTVTVSGGATFGATSGLYGGITLGPGAGDAFSDNRLNVWNYSDSSAVASVQNFQYFNFLLPAGFKAGDTALTATGMITLGNGVIGSTVERVDFMGGGNALRPGDSINLLAAGGGVAGTLENDGQSLSGKKGAALLYTLQLHQGANAVTATLLGVQTNPQMKALSEGYLSGSALINQGADLIAGQGMNEAVRSAKAARAGISGNYGIGLFGALSGGYSRYDTGSHVDMGSISLMTGLSWGADLTPGRLTLGAFFEYGNGSYDTYNSFSNAASVHGDGDIYHIGGGILGRMDFKDTGPGHIYAEGSFRAGGVHNEYGSGDLRDDLGNRTGSHDTSSAYYGIHLGTGYLWNITDKASLDLYGKYFWTRQEGDSVRLSTGDPVTFKAVDSSRLRLGGRFAYAINEYVSPYVGAAYEHEFDGKARATTYGYDIKAPSLRGSTGIGELGLTLKPSQTLPLSFDLGIQGYVGKREGITGSLQVKWEF